MGLNASAYGARDKNKYCKIAKDLITEYHFTVDEARDFAPWLRDALSWRSTPIDMFDVKRQLGGWRAKGRPKFQQSKETSTRFADGTLKVF